MRLTQEDWQVIERALQDRVNWLLNAKSTGSCLHVERQHCEKLIIKLQAKIKPAHAK